MKVFWRLLVGAFILCFGFSISPKIPKTYSQFLSPVSNMYPKRGVEIWPGMGVQYQGELYNAHPLIIKTYLLWSRIESSQGVYVWDVAFDADYPIIKSIGDVWLVLKMSPSWARLDTRECGRVVDISAFADFARRVALRYPEIMFYEIWNEPDSSNGLEYYYGCWGNPDEPDYGGAYYATVINPVRESIQFVNPNAQVYFGGLVVSPNTLQAEYFRGAVKAGAQFDGVAIHHYTWFSRGNASPEQSVNIIRQVMTEYDYTHPIMLTETSMVYDGSGEPYETAQADYLKYIDNEVSRLGLLGFIWYTLPDSGWSHSGMMEGSRLKPVYYQFSSYGETN